jgi:hypothetical protein
MNGPRIELAIIDRKPVYAPGEVLECEFRLRDVDLQEISALETSVMFQTEGKGDEDLGVHFFRRRRRREISPDDSDRPFRFSVTLPRSPLTYEGVIVKVRWCVRVRLFYRRGRSETAETFFRLGQVSSPEQWDGVGRLPVELASEDDDGAAARPEPVRTADNGDDDGL